jgi:hypothetical protein
MQHASVEALLFKQLRMTPNKMIKKPECSCNLHEEENNIDFINR